MNDITKGRLTAKRLIEWLNNEFERFEINEWTVTDVYRTRYRNHEYEAGACKLIISFESKSNNKNRGTFLCFYSIAELKEHMNMGYKMILSFPPQTQSLTDLTIDLKKAGR